MSSIFEQIQLYFSHVKKLVRDALPTRLYSKASQIYHQIPADIEAAILHIKIRKKWYCDNRSLPLTHEHRELYDIIHRLTWTHLGEFPNLVNCRDFNDRIQWLKLFDQTDQNICCSDKLLVRDYVRDRVGEQYLTMLYQVKDRFDDIDFNSLPTSFVIKTNNDSGTVTLVRDKALLNYPEAREKIEKARKTPFGWEMGEWAYSFVKPKVLVEEFIAPEASAPPADYKFYVVNGSVQFIHYIYDRGLDTKEQTLAPDGRDMNTELYRHFRLGHDFVKPACWEEMKDLAATLGKGFKCVRVDLFNNQNRIYVGEMTFWPMYGCYQGEGQKQLGQLLDFDRTTFKPPIYQKLKRAE